MVENVIGQGLFCVWLIQILDGGWNEGSTTHHAHTDDADGHDVKVVLGESGGDPVSQGSHGVSVGGQSLLSQTLHVQGRVVVPQSQPVTVTLCGSLQTQEAWLWKWYSVGLVCFICSIE